MNYAWANQGTAVLDLVGDCDRLLARPGYDGLRIMRGPAPAPPYTYTVELIPHFPEIKVPTLVGLLFRASASGKLITLSLQSEAGVLSVAVQKFSSPTRLDSSYPIVSPAIYAEPETGIIRLQISDDGTDCISRVWDGNSFVVVHSVKRTDFTLTDEVGFFACANQDEFNVAVNIVSAVLT